MIPNMLMWMIGGWDYFRRNLALALLILVVLGICGGIERGTLF